MSDYFIIVCLAGLVIFGYLWKKSSSSMWYRDADNDPVSLKSIFGFIWMVLFFVLIISMIRMIP